MDQYVKSAEDFKGNGSFVAVASVADILERELQTLIKEWLTRVEKEPELMRIPLNYEERAGHLPRLMQDVNVRLRRDDHTKAAITKAAGDNGGFGHSRGTPVS